MVVIIFIQFELSQYTNTCAMTLQWQVLQYQSLFDASRQTPHPHQIVYLIAQCRWNGGKRILFIQLCENVNLHMIMRNLCLIDIQNCVCVTTISVNRITTMRRICLRKLPQFAFIIICIIVETGWHDFVYLYDSRQSI